MPEQQRYTLAQAQQLLAEQECRDHGHDWTVIDQRTMANPAGTPLAVVCNTCKQSHTVTTTRCPDDNGPRCELHCPNP